MSDFDAIVVGAGLGGLSGATFLSKEGRKVLLLDRHNVPGGYASSFRRGRFEFEISLHELSGLGGAEESGPLRRLLGEAGIEGRVEFIRIPEFFRCVFPDVDITVPIGRESFETELGRHFPSEAENIKDFSAVMFDFADQALKANRVGMKKVMAAASDYPVLMEHFGKSLSQVLDPMVADERARAVLGQIWGYYCLPPSQLSFLIYALGTVSYLRFGPAYVKGTSQALSQAFMDVIEENGGEVWLNNGASRILATGGKVYGVVADNGERIDCARVVCNVNPYTACLELIGRDRLPGWYLRRLGAGTAGASTFNVYLGLDCDYRDVGLENHETFVNTGYDLDGHYEIMKAGIDVEPAEAAVTAYNAVDPDFSPPGTAVVVITLVARAEPWLKVAPADYDDTKARVADRVIGLAERAAPGIRDHIEVVEVATPLTNARYTGNLSGSIIGFNETFKGTGLDRLPSQGPLEGLHFAGAWVNIGGGYEPSIYSGYLAARQVIEEIDGIADPRRAAGVRRRIEEQAGAAEEVKESAILPIKERLGELHPRRVALRVAEVIDETETAKTFRMETDGGALPPFRAGQYVNLFVEIEGVATSRPFSIASAPGSPYWDLTVRGVPGGFVSSHLLEAVKPGDRFESTGPAGSFCYEPLSDTGSLVLLAGGSGITPFISMLREAVRRRSPVDVHVIYGSRDPGDVIYARELERLTLENENVKVDTVVSEPPLDYEGPRGLLDREMISGLIGSVEGRTFFICGPQAMYPLCRGALEELGVPARHVKTEVYGPAADVTEEPGWPGVAPDALFRVTELRTGLEFEAAAREPLMNSLEREGIVIPAICRAGECGACRTRLVAGRVFTPARIETRRVDRAAGFIHPCMSYPIEDLVLRV